MGKIIIQNDSSKSDSKVIHLLLNVLGDGRVSGNGTCYSYVTVFFQDELAIYADVTRKGTDKFVIRDHKQTVRTKEE